MPDAASDSVKAVYQDVQQTLRVPFVNFLFRLLANDASYLEQQWRALRPAAASLQFEEAADRLRASSLVAVPMTVMYKRP